MDAYDILQVKKDATVAEITTAYRRAAMRYHPDRNPDSPSAKENFQRLHQAYRELLKIAGEAEKPLDWDEVFAEFAELEETEEEEEHPSFVWQEELPRLSILFIVVGVLSFVGLEARVGVAVAAVMLLCAYRVYRTPFSIVGLRLERRVKFFIRLYFLLVLLAGVMWLLKLILARAAVF